MAKRILTHLIYATTIALGLTIGSLLMLAWSVRAADLQWTAAQCGDPPAPCVAGMTGYEVWGSVNGREYEVVGTTPPDVLLLTDVDPTGVYRVRLMSMDGRVSAWSLPSTPPPPPPPAPGTEGPWIPAGVPVIITPVAP